MRERPYTLLSCGISIDGYLDRGTGERLILSNEADLDRVDDVRAGCDAILVGAATIRHDNPRLLVRKPARVRAAGGAGAASYADEGDRDPTVPSSTRAPTSSPPATARSSSTAPATSVLAARRRLGSVATVVDGGQPVDVRRMSEDLRTRGVRRLMVEGGGNVHTQFLTADLADELQLVVAPFFVGDSRASRFVGDGRFPFNPGRRARLAEVRPIGDVVLLRYALSSRFCLDLTEESA